jgi:hypothetical protein
MRKDVPFKFSVKEIVAQEDLKQALIDSLALKSIDYSSSVPVVLSVNTSSIAIGFLLTQCNPENPQK